MRQILPVQRTEFRSHVRPFPYCRIPLAMIQTSVLVPLTFRPKPENTNTAGMIITPARNATPVSIISICDTALFRSTSFLTYEPYVIIIPIDTLREKNSWLIASSVICRKRPTVIPVRSGFHIHLKPLQSGTYRSIIQRSLQCK